MLVRQDKDLVRLQNKKQQISNLKIQLQSKWRMKLKMKSQLKGKRTLVLATKMFLLLQNSSRKNLQSKNQMLRMDSNTFKNGLIMNILTK